MVRKESCLLYSDSRRVAARRNCDDKSLLVYYGTIIEPCCVRACISVPISMCPYGTPF